METTTLRDTILQGDALSTLRTLPDGIVQTCVTSPPYWGLRDYGTARWEGGDPKCSHSIQRRSESSTLGLAKGQGSHDAAMRREAAVVVPYRDTCGKCGAKREDELEALHGTGH